MPTDLSAWDDVLSNADTPQQVLAGHTCRIAIPIQTGSDSTPAVAISFLQSMCEEHGLTATNVHLVSTAPSVDDIGPHPGITFHIYEATAA